MKKLIALAALAGLFAVGCAHREKNMGGDYDNSTGSQKYQSNPSSSSSSSSSWSDTNSTSSNPSSTSSSVDTNSTSSNPK